jgi:hypothetical protein
VNDPQTYQLRLTRVHFDDPMKEAHITFLFSIPGDIDREKAEAIIGWEALDAWRRLHAFIRKSEVGEE